MRAILLIVAVLLVLASGVTHLMTPRGEAGGTLIYWVTDPNPARAGQIDAFNHWQIDRGHTDESGNPLVTVKVDVANQGLAKLLIQSVSGVAGDVLDIHRGGEFMQLFADLGVLRDITDIAEENGFGLDATYDALETELVFDGAQLGYPCNVADESLIVNREAFTSRGLEPPPRRWTFDEFEQAGLAFVAAANTPGERQTHFFVDRVMVPAMIRSLGLSIFNETLTASDLDDPRYAEVLGRIERWIDLGLLPSLEALASMSGESGPGGLFVQQFRAGRYAVLWRGRYVLVMLRRLGVTSELSASEPPHGGYPNSSLRARSAAIYAGSRHPEAAELFLQFLASDRYNQLIVDDPDAMPPNPASLVGNTSFLDPPSHPNEVGVHGAILEMTNEIAIGGAYSPFVLFTDVQAAMRLQEDRVRAGLTTPEDASRDAAAAINAAIARSLRDRPHLQEEYNRRVQRQQEIDRRLAAGELIPESWIENIFYRRYYKQRGMLEPDLASLHTTRSAASLPRTPQ